MEASRTLAASGTTPWAIGLESGASSGWVGADWLENIFLRMYGPGTYADWCRGRLPWTAPEMRAAWQAWGRIVDDPKMVYGGSHYVLSTPFGQAFAPLFLAPPKALFHFQASFIQGFIQKEYPNQRAGEDYRFFPFPAVRPEYAKAVVVAGRPGVHVPADPTIRGLRQGTSASAPAQAFWAVRPAGFPPTAGCPWRSTRIRSAVRPPQILTGPMPWCSAPMT